MAGQYPQPNPNFDLIERVVGNESDEYDSGVFSQENGPINSQLPIFLTRHGNNVSKSSRRNATCNPNGVRRLVRKSGKSNIVRTQIPDWTAYVRDLANTLVNTKWRWTLLCFGSSYVFSWLLFAWFYMLIARDNNDVSDTDPSPTPCLVGIRGFAGYFLFSLETQHTIGYGSRFITSNCPEGTFLVCLQVIMGCALCGGMASIVYTKMVRPRASRSKALFSKTALVCQRDGVLCLMFRVRDEDSKHQVDTKIHAYLVDNRAQKPFLKSINLERQGFLLWPLEVVHQITPSSPFWDLSAKDLISRRFELIVTLQGISITTGQCSRTRTSYITSEILWGHRFKPCVKFDNDRSCYFVDNVDFNTTEEVLTPLCSAKRLNEIVQDINDIISSPFYATSPATSRSFRYSDDEESSGIGSMRDSFRESFREPPKDEHLSPVSDHSRKLSTIREYYSAENLRPSSGIFENTMVEKIPSESLLDSINKEESVPLLASNVVGTKGGEKDSSSSLDRLGNLNKLVTEVEHHVDDIQKQFPDGSSARNSGAFDVEGLIASLQNYLCEIEGGERSKTFTETNL